MLLICLSLLFAYVFNALLNLSTNITFDFVQLDKRVYKLYLAECEMLLLQELAKISIKKNLTVATWLYGHGKIFSCFVKLSPRMAP